MNFDKLCLQKMKEIRDKYKRPVFMETEFSPAKYTFHKDYSLRLPDRTRNIFIESLRKKSKEQETETMMWDAAHKMIRKGISILTNEDFDNISIEKLQTDKEDSNSLEEKIKALKELSRLPGLNTTKQIVKNEQKSNDKGKCGQNQESNEKSPRDKGILSPNGECQREGRSFNEARQKEEQERSQRSETPRNFKKRGISHGREEARNSDRKTPRHFFPSPGYEHSIISDRTFHSKGEGLFSSQKAVKMTPRPTRMQTEMEAGRSREDFDSFQIGKMGTNPKKPLISEEKIKECLSHLRSKNLERTNGSINKQQNLNSCPIGERLKAHIRRKIILENIQKVQGMNILSENDKRGLKLAQTMVPNEGKRILCHLSCNVRFSDTSLFI